MFHSSTFPNCLNLQYLTIVLSTLEGFHTTNSSKFQTIFLLLVVYMSIVVVVFSKPKSGVVVYITCMHLHLQYPAFL